MKGKTMRRNVLAKRLLLLALICLSGCLSHVAMRKDQVNYSRAYGDSSNEQLLLNLARLANDDPVYFVQLGSISSAYQFGTSAGFSPSYVNNTPSFYQSS